MAAPQQHSTVYVAAVASGATLGTVARFAALALWPGNVGEFVSTQLTTGFACLVLGAMSATGARRAAQGLVIGFVGAAASLGVLGMLAISAEPLVSAAYLVGTPLSALIGLAAGSGLASVRRERKTQCVDRG